MPDFSLELALTKQGVKNIAGVDEAGRGPLAGPVVCAAVCFNSFDKDQIAKLSGLNDSKKLSANKRAKLFDIIISCASVSIISLPPRIIDEKNILQATLCAMRKANLALEPKPDHILIDGRDIPQGLAVPASAIIKGDRKSLSIAAASIVAKQVRDSMCPIMDKDYSLKEDVLGYGFANHKGYGTKTHLAALERLGACKHHRFSYAPVAKVST